MPDPENNIDYSKLLAQASEQAQSTLNDLGNDISRKAYDPYAEAKPYSYNAASTNDPNKNFERFYSHGDYDKLGYNPWSDNEALYNEKGSASGDVWRAVKAGGKLAATGFKSSLRSWQDIASGDPLKPDYESADEMRYYNTVGSSSRGGVTGFASNLIVNSGYTVGIIGEMALETAALTALEVGSFGGATPAVAVGVGKLGMSFGKLRTAIKGISEAVNTYKEFGAAKAAWEATKTVGKFVNPLERTTELFSGAEKIKEFKSLDNLAKTSKTAGAFYRDLQMANLTLSESKMEGGMAEQDLENSLKDEYRAAHGGMEPDIDALSDIKQTAKDAGLKTLAWNIPTIFLTNKITFEPLFRPLDKVIGKSFAPGKWVEKGNEIVRGTFRNTALASLKPKNILKATTAYFGANLSEGFQEVSQDVISGTAKDYYTKLLHNKGKQGLDFAQGENQGNSVWDALSKNVTDQFSGKGFETFASGFLMGGLVGVAGHAVRAPYQAIKDYKKEKTNYEIETQKVLNDINKDPLKFFGAGILNYANGTESVEGQAQSEKKNDQKEWLDFEDQNLTSQVMTALETNTYEPIFLEKLKRIKTMDQQAIKDAYGFDGQEVLNKIDKIIARAETVKESYDKWSENYQNPFNPRRYKPDTEEYIKEAHGYLGWEAAKKLAVFNEATFNRNLNRIQGVGNDLSSSGVADATSAADISLLFSPDGIRNEMKLLDDEIEVLDNSLVPGDKNVLKAKKDKRKYLDNFLDKLQGYYYGQHIDNASEERKSNPEFKKLFGEQFKTHTKDQLYKAYSDYVSHLVSNKINGNVATLPHLNDSFQQLLDLHELKQENIYYADAINTLANPRKFIEQQKRLTEVFSNLYNQREDIINTSIKAAQAKIEDNTILTALFHRGFTLSPSAAEKLLQGKAIPKEFYDINARQVVDNRDKIKYAEFIDIIRNYLEATRKEEKKNEEKQNSITKGIRITNLEEIIAKGSGRIEIEKDGKIIEFTTFDIAIDPDTNTAEVGNVHKKDETANKGIGFAAYVELGRRLAEKGITLVSGINNARNQSGTDLWNKLVKEGYATGSSNKGYTFIQKDLTEIKPSESLVETQVIEQARELHVDIAKKFDDVHNGEQLVNLTEELMSLMAETTLEERLKAGLNSKNIDEKIKEKEQELLTKITLDNLFVGNILSMVDPDYGTMKVVKKTSHSVVLQKIGDGNIKVTIEKNKLRENIKSKYSDKMGKDLTKATQPEKEKVATNLNKGDKFLENRDLLKEVMEEAYANEGKYEKDFIENLGCK